VLGQPGPGQVGAIEDVVQRQQQVTLAATIAAREDEVALAVGILVGEADLEPMQEASEGLGGERGGEDTVRSLLEGVGIVGEHGVQGDNAVEVPGGDLGPDPNQVDDPGHREHSWTADGTSRTIAAWPTTPSALA